MGTVPLSPTVRNSLLDHGFSRLNPGMEPRKDSRPAMKPCEMPSAETLPVLNANPVTARPAESTVFPIPMPPPRMIALPATAPRLIFIASLSLSSPSSSDPANPPANPSAPWRASPLPKPRSLNSANTLACERLPALPMLATASSRALISLGGSPRRTASRLA